MDEKGMAPLAVYPSHPTVALNSIFMPSRYGRCRNLYKEGFLYAIEK